MNWKRLGVILIGLGLLSEFLALQAWWYIGQNIEDLLGWFIPPQAIADLLDSGGSLIWLGIALLIERALAKG